MSDPIKVPRRPVVLIVLDGVGTNPSKADNAVALAHTPRLDEYFAHFPHTLLQASGRAVGLPDGQMGNSEVGHVTLGSGCVVRQDLVLIDDAIANRSFFDNAALTEAARRAAAQGRPVHLMGLVSDGGVHSHLRHLTALIELCRRQGAAPVLHMFTDGRDTPPRSAEAYLEPVEAALAEAGGRIATLSGRYYAMDRDKRWERTELAWRALVLGEGRMTGSAREAIAAAYEAGEDDEFIRPTVIAGGEAIRDGDQVIHFNFRKDRPRQMVAALCEAGFDHFERPGFQGAAVTCMMSYDASLGLPFAFASETPVVTLGGVLSEAGLAQFHCAETEKYAHVTYFFNGGRGEPWPGEEQRLIPSPKVATYDLQPQMSAPEVADAVIEALRSRRFPFVVVNFANGDMVGHTAVREAVIAAVEVLDREAGRVMDAAREEGYSIVLTADHGNCDELVDPVTGTPQTQHSIYPVPCLVVDEVPWRLAIGAGIERIAPTVLDLMGLPVPEPMHGRSLLLGQAVN
ncbi:2,3-bisphosphoglycerate-independent phosphoglycerate mutase [Thioflavicoccus mobilis 8321]|uniref:2,3-bisphosphoglycerate-independent phosphoglycerate mutase n=1 Tax=Thioflavicoccus mobilis 8321 TaxID=765912 RepID=L0H385_9GAMM|nr:2,3-bisphosphoglycerate-independent phosphoglycerate mutase [Thioflavicoccus mobilis]AGA92044.1 2,3-bisphosphoglycerate-independent phosphoglycerate mutase [Thioflavicoccus mobilis 8321]